MSLFLLKNSQFEPAFNLKDVLIHLHVYCNVPNFPSYMFIWPCTFINFPKIFLPSRLFRPTLVLGTPEYWFGLVVHCAGPGFRVPVMGYPNIQGFFLQPKGG